MKRKKTSLLWQINGGQLQQPCYLFGTMHVRDERVFAQIEAIKAYIQQCDSFAAEFDLTNLEAKSQGQAIWYDESLSLRQLLGKGVYTKLAEIFRKSTRMSLREFDHFWPVTVSNLLMETQFYKDYPVSLDEELAQFAQLQGKKMLGLELFSEQLDLIQQIPLKSQLKSLKTIATNFAKVKRNIQTSTELYLQADLVGLYKLVKKQSGSLKELLIYQRNLNMVGSFLEKSAESSLFAAVGAGHLAGSRGILRLLQQAGCKVAPVPYMELRLGKRSD